jgi:hypothetical protein
MQQATMDKHKHLLAPGTWDSAYQFTNNCCYDERQTYALIKKTGGTKCGPSPGRDCDKVARRSDGVMFDMVRGGGAPGQAAQFAQQEGFCKPEDYAEPQPYDGTQPGPTPTPTPPANTVPYHPYDGDDKWLPVTRIMESDYKRANGVGLDSGCGMWIGRTIHDCYMEKNPATGKLFTLDESIAKHRVEWCAILGVPVQ